MLVRPRAALLLGAFLLAPILAAPAAAATTTPSPSPSAPTSGSAASPPKVTFGLGPSTKGVLDRRPGISMVQARGATVKDEVTVVNLSDRPLTLDVYPVDVYNDVNGNLEPQVAAAKPQDAGAWVTMATPGGKRAVVVPGRGNVIVPITVTIPKNAAVGDHLAGLMVSLTAKGQSTGQVSAPVDLDQRVGIRLSIRVAGQLKPELTVSGIDPVYTGSLLPWGRGSAQVTYVVTNTGNVKLGGHQRVAVNGLFGAAAAPLDVADLPVLLPGGKATVTVQVPDVAPMGLLSADVTVVPLPAQGDAVPELSVATASAKFWAIPWTLLALLLLLAGLAAWWWRRRHRVPPVEPGRRHRGATSADTGLVGAASAPSNVENS